MLLGLSAVITWPSMTGSLIEAVLRFHLLVTGEARPARAAIADL
jgi:hypothetical protein